MVIWHIPLRIISVLHICSLNIYSRPPLSMGYIFQDPRWRPETVDGTLINFFNPAGNVAATFIGRHSFSSNFHIFHLKLFLNLCNDLLLAVNALVSFVSGDTLLKSLCRLNAFLNNMLPSISWNVFSFLLPTNLMPFSS